MNTTTPVLILAFVALAPFAIYTIIFLVQLLSQSSKINFAERKAIAYRKTQETMESIYKPFIIFFTFLIDVLKMMNLALFLAWFAGADLKLLRTMPSSVIAKRATFGFAMFAAVAVSAIVAGIVWADILKSSSAGIFVGTLWFFAIAAIDRAIMVFMDHSNSAGAKKWLIVSLRLIMVAGISFINTTFAEMKIFDKEIAQVIEDRKESSINGVSDSIATVINGIEAKKQVNADLVNQKTTDYQSWLQMNQDMFNARLDSLHQRENNWIGEIEGLVGSGKKGYGPAATAKKQAIVSDSIRLAKEMADFEVAKASSPLLAAMLDAKDHKVKDDADLDAQIAKLRNFEAKKSAEINDAALDGFSHRYSALHQVAKDTPVLVWAVFILFFLFESLAILLKIMMGRDAYDESIRLQTGEFVAEKQYNQLIAVQNKRNDFEKNYNAAVFTGITQQSMHYATRQGAEDMLHQNRLAYFDQLAKHTAESIEQLREAGADDAMIEEFKLKVVSNALKVA